MPQEIMIRGQLILGLMLLVSGAIAQSVQPIWLSPLNTKYDTPADYMEQFPERGVWANITVGAGSRTMTPAFVMDSKGILWIMFGLRISETRYENFLLTVWNYDPKKDLYRWVAGPGNTTTYYRNPGVLQVPTEDNFPGGFSENTAVIDYNDNIWFSAYEKICCELWMFNTTSLLFTRIQRKALTFCDSSDCFKGLGDLSQDAHPNYTTVGVPGPEVTPGYISLNCMVTDSTNNLWLISGASGIWHFNTTSLWWTYFGDPSLGQYVVTSFGEDPIYGGRAHPGCDIDEEDRIWLYGGQGLAAPGYFSDVWSFDTRSRQFKLENGNETNKDNKARLVSADFSRDNAPPAGLTPSLVNRNDGTLLLFSSYSTDIWLFNKSSSGWKLASGNPNPGDYPGNFSHYRTPGSAMRTLIYTGNAAGLNINGDGYIIGGLSGGMLGRKEIWLVPYDQCTNNAHKCSVDAQCIEEMVGYSCECNQGFIGDGFTCTAPPVTPIDIPISEPTTSPENDTEPLPSPIEAIPNTNPQPNTNQPSSSTVSSAMTLTFSIGSVGLILLAICLC